VNIEKPQLVLITSDADLDYRNVAQILYTKKVFFAFYGETMLSFSDYGPYFKGSFPAPPALNIVQFATRVFDKKLISQKDKAHVEMLLTDKIGIVEIEGAVNWEKVHEIKYLLMDYFEKGEMIGAFFLFHSLDMSVEEKESLLRHLLSFIKDMHIDTEFIKILSLDPELKQFFKFSKLGLTIEQVKSFEEAFLKLEGLVGSSSHGLAVEYLKSGRTYIEDIYDNKGKQIKKRGEAFTPQEINTLKNRGVEKVFFARDLGKKNIPIDSESVAEGKTKFLGSISGRSLLQPEEKKKVLIIDDDNLTQTIIGKMLEMMEIEYRVASNGQDGLKYALLMEPDLILLDLLMPRLNGVEFYKSYLSKTKNPAPILVISGLSRKEVVEPLLKMGVRDYILKPIDLNVLKEKIWKNIK
jgi:CheY-like chemotaxis protein